ncbi:MAG: anti-sigma F factor [Lachnospiraceae bacterium]|nr:anti-sigma F factor [Lachnospiraceae bacterium]
MKNEMQIEFDAKSVNEGFARVAAAAFLTQLDPTLDEIADVKTAVSEAVTNAIIHGYEEREGKVFLSCRLEGDTAVIVVEDKGVGMENIEQAMEPFYTTKPELERSGMGFAFMEAFMDQIAVESEAGVGTKVTMVKKIGQKEEENQNECGDRAH